jgi:8-oxo-dGTP pyrophosphatase MutT (NUDIX family)
MPRDIDVTVAAVVEREQRFLIVEERVRGGFVLNQPAGHLEPNESLVDAAVRETFEETGFRFTPQHVLGVYLWRSAEADKSFLRIAFIGEAQAPTRPTKLDDGIVAVHWLTRNQLLGRSAELRSPMVMQCIDDYRAGVRYPLDCLTSLSELHAGRVHNG